MRREGNSLLSAGETGVKYLFEQMGGQFVPRLAVCAAVLVNGGQPQQRVQALELAQNLAAGGVGLQHLPDPAPEGALEAEDPAAGVGTLRGFKQQVRRQGGSEGLLDLGKGGTTPGLDGLAEAGSQGSQLRAPGREEGGLHVQC